MKQRLIARAKALREHPYYPKVKKAAHQTLVAGIMLLLGWNLWKTGWRDVLAALPTTPLFYLAFAGIYFTLPVAESFLFSRLWNTPKRALFLALMKRRVFNKDVMGYSGEVYLYLWAKNRVQGGERKVRLSMKDNLIVSSIISTLFPLSLLAFFLLTGWVSLPFGWAEHSSLLLYAGGGLLVLVLTLVLTRLKSVLFHQSGRDLLFMALIHFLRLAASMGLTVFQWASVAPDIALSTWFLFLSIQIIVTRLPVPSVDLLFATISMGIASQTEVAASMMAGILLTHAVLDKLSNAMWFTGISLWEKKGKMQVNG